MPVFQSLFSLQPYRARRGNALMCASLLALVAAAPALVQPALAQSAPQTEEESTQTSSSEAINLPDVVVSATLIPTPESHVASSVTVITQQEIQRQQWRSLPDALQTTPGLNVVQTGGPGGQTSVFIRGTDSGQVKIMMDGIDLGDPSSTNGAFNLGNMFTNDLARIEVLRGPQSGLYGSDAIGGVIAMTTARGQGPGTISGFMEGGSMRTFNQGATLNGAVDRFSYNLNFGHFKSSAIKVTPDYVLSPGVPAYDNANDNWTLSGRFDFDLTDNLTLNYTARYIDTRLNFTTSTSVPEGVGFAHGKFFINKGEGIWKALDDKLISTFGISSTNYSRDNSGYYNDYDYDGDRQTYYWRSNYNFMPGQNLLVGVERKNEKMTNTPDGPWGISTGDTVGYAELQSSFWERLFVAANIRYDSDDDYGDHTTWRIAPALLIPETGTKLKFTYGTGFKAPSLYQLYAPASSWGPIGNANLQPEESKGWDVGFEQQALNNRVSFGATYFRNDLTNLIAFTSNGYENAQRAKTYGVEAFAALELNDQFSVRADYTYTKAIGYEMSSSSCKQRGDGSCYLLRRPDNKFSVTMNWQPMDQLTLAATLVYLSDWWDTGRSGGPIVKQSGYTLVNLAANYEVNQNLSVYGRLDNLFDEGYEEPRGYLAPGFAAYAGVRVTY
ncbi:TonB-dependent receptor plug domain-containing protein [Xanthobacter sp. TB0136]|uniref:TonB-dependent receptor plug domain-containing protein n=1 Tax=Xanthobacter sp. TB0136 TaxID=3459177 RepID=UPI00403A74DC